MATSTSSHCQTLSLQASSGDASTSPTVEIEKRRELIVRRKAKLPGAFIGVLMVLSPLAAIAVDCQCKEYTDCPEETPLHCRREQNGPGFWECKQFCSQQCTQPPDPNPEPKLYNSGCCEYFTKNIKFVSDGSGTCEAPPNCITIIQITWSASKQCKDSYHQSGNCLQVFHPGRCALVSGKRV